MKTKRERRAPVATSSAGQGKRSLRVDAEKVGRTAAFGGAGGMDDVLPRPVVLHVGMELLGEFRLVAEVQFDEMDARSVR